MKHLFIVLIMVLSISMVEAQESGFFVNFVTDEIAYFNGSSYFFNVTADKEFRVEFVNNARGIPIFRSGEFKWFCIGKMIIIPIGNDIVLWVKIGETPSDFIDKIGIDERTRDTLIEMEEYANNYKK